MARYDLTDFEWRVIEPLLTMKSRGVPRVDDRRVLNGIFWVLRSGSPWRDLPERYGPYTTVYNRFNRWRKAGVWDRLMDAIVQAHDGKVQMIDSSIVRVHQQAAAQKTGWKRLYRSKSWGTDDQDAPARHRQRPARADRTFERRGQRRADGAVVARRPAEGCACARRQRLRC